MYVCITPIDLLRDLVVGADLVLIADTDTSLLSFQVLETGLQLRNAAVILELMETPLQNELRIDPVHSQQVQHHVVGLVECRVERMGLSLEQTTS